MGKLFDVDAVNIQTGTRRVMKERMTYADADAYMRMAVMRRGVDEEFFQVVPHEPCTCGHRAADHDDDDGHCYRGSWQRSDSCGCLGYEPAPHSAARER